MADILPALVRSKLTKQFANGGPQFIDGVGGGFSEQGFQLGKDFLNRVVMCALTRHG
jgi:hypothetical protein